MDLADIQFLVAIQKDQTALIYTLWSVFQGLSFLLIGFVFSQEYVRNNPLILSCFSLSILLFSVGNHSAIMRAQALVDAATRQLNAAAATNMNLKGVLEAFHAPETEMLAWFHIAFAVCVAAGVWVPLAGSRISGYLGNPKAQTGKAKK
jgi:hypothetical protein